MKDKDKDKTKKKLGDDSFAKKREGQESFVTAVLKLPKKGAVTQKLSEIVHTRNQKMAIMEGKK